ncbi:Emp47p KNAG_0E02990 [Huiozyma naganishii CBS 8797]|uniref:L-type lectin-like domain-containing protein n=1 Tax=Huiozyma naganishii (strain ATCC MYA-139 / BCRC 22969 / CBS 8797 / KCTC 17520 / NBRC 10181 / NCYC 3082 / Yp74L-3) TaxID=1071383 RepID=J7RLZ0_HUIN7|nr:hypothetical protein KNAG_0E02990 [Kazachstania naganishii CBS 8797]CCK70558.1 hypothetical protein KNAG_0E02990 [Kazachstania naganishii CBS 8797]
MLLLKAVFAALCTFGSVTAHSPETSAHAKGEKPLAEYSLPDLISAGDKIPSNWDVKDRAVLKEGRFILTPEKKSKGSLWLKPEYNLKDSGSFTVEWTFRSLGFSGKSNGGLAFWMVLPTDVNDQALFNGPSKFNGLQLLVDDNSVLSQSIHAQVSDGSQIWNSDSIHDHSFASCLMGYQDSSVPLSLRLTYDSADDHLLKLQVDNRVCFQTRKINLANTLNSVKFGVSASNENTPEAFEVLQMHFYNYVTQDSLIPNVNSMGQPKMLTKVVDEKTGTEKIMDKDELEAQNTKITNYELYKKMNRLEGKILANDINTLDEKVAQIMKIQEQLIHQLDQLSTAVQGRQDNSGKPNDKEQFKDFLSMDKKLEALLDEQAKIRENTRQAGINQHSGPQMDEIMRKLVIWMIPLIIIMLVMAYYTFKIKQEIAKTKLL